MPAIHTATNCVSRSAGIVTSEKRLELTVTLDDPKAYTKPWVALDKLQFVQIPSNTDLIEMMNSASEAQAVAASYRAK